MLKTRALCVLFACLAGAAFGQTITVTSPRSGDTWRIGEPHVITWTKSGTMDDQVKVRLVQRGDVVLEIAERTANTGSCPWTIPASVIPGNYVIRVRTIDGAVMDNSDEFAIAAAAPSQSSTPARRHLTLTSPNGRERIAIGRPYRIIWKADPGGPTGATVDLSLWHEGRSLGVIAEGIPLKVGLFDWTAGRLQGGTVPPGSGFKVRIRVHDTSYEDESDQPFILAEIPETGGDLELVALENDGNKVVARIRSTFPRFANSVMYEMRRPVGAPTPVYRYHLDMLFEGPGERVYTMDTVFPSRPTDAEYCCSTYEMFLDTTNRIEETNEQNNHQTACLYGNPTFAVIDSISWGTTGRVQRNQTLNVRPGGYEVYSLPGIHESGQGNAPWRVPESLYIELRNCGYNRILNGELRVSQVGYLYPDEKPGSLGGGFLPSYRTVVLLRLPVDLSPLGIKANRRTDFMAFHPVPSEIIVEYIWEGEGIHSDRAVFRFNVDFQFDRQTPKP
jgi:Kre9/KNH-like N-terminal Ig-like domain